MLSNSTCLCSNYSKERNRLDFCGNIWKIYQTDLHLPSFSSQRRFFLSFVFVKVFIISKGKVKLTNLMSIIIYYIKHLEVFTFLLFVCVHSLRSVFFSQNGLNILRSACQTLLKGFLDKTAQSLSNASLIFN